MSNDSIMPMSHIGTSFLAHSPELYQSGVSASENWSINIQPNATSGVSHMSYTRILIYEI